MAAAIICMPIIYLPYTCYKRGNYGHFQCLVGACVDADAAFCSGTCAGYGVG